MTLDTTIPSNPSYILQHGCRVTVMPTDQINRIEVWRAPDGDTGTALGAQTSTTLKDTTKAWVVNGFTGTTVQITAGLGSGQSRTVASNTSDTLTVTVAWVTTPDGTSVYKITGAVNDAAAVQATFLPPAQLTGATFIDSLPNDGAKRYYKSRHVDASGNVSTFTLYSDALIPEVISGAGAPNPMAAFGAIVDQEPPNTQYEMRFSPQYTDPDAADGVQSFIDFVATTYFMRLGQKPKLVEAATNATPISVQITGHGYATGDSVVIRGHLGNTAANSTAGSPWTITVTTNDTFTLNGSVGSGADTPSTGHCVRLSMTIDGLGNLIVYAVIKAYSFVVNGIATFNGALTSLGNALFRTLQHSTAGAYGDTNINRVMLRNNNVEVMGDARSSGGENNPTTTLGSYSIVSGGVTTARSSQDVGLTAGSKGWTDPDGSDNGLNTLTVARGGNTTVAAASRLWCKLGDPTNEGDNVDAYDDQYTVTFRVQAKLASDNVNSECDATVTIEVSTDSGANWSNAASSYTVYGFDSAGSMSTFSPVVTVAGNPTHVWFRLVLNVQTYGLAGGPNGIGTVWCFSSAYRTNNYAVTWTTSTATIKQRRNLKIYATSDGTDQQPHAYLVPTSAVLPDGNGAEGEVQFVGDTAHALAYRDDEKMRYVPKVLIVDGNKSITAGSETQISTVTVKAAHVNVVSRGLRIRATGRIGANTGTVILKIANQSFSSINLTSGQSWEFDHIIYTNAVGASGSLSVGGRKGQGTTYTADEGNITVDLTADFQIEIKGLTTAGVALVLRAFVVEWLY